MRQVVFLILPDVEILDLAGPLQVFHEANRCGARYRTRLAAAEPRLCSDQGLWLSDLEPFPDDTGPDAVSGSVAEESLTLGPP
jgi:transcriptional regulator GlxA family with amidase domain